jgi:uncharacterized protein (DUF1778 family)
MARPKKDHEKNRPARVSFRITEDVNQGLRELAKARGAELSDVVHDLLEKGLREAARAAARHRR